MSLLGIDIGSSRCKGVVFDTAGKNLASVSVPYAIDYPSPGWAQVDAQVFWSAVVTIVRKLSEMVANDPIRAMAISSHGETFIPVDKDGKALGPAIMNSDNRAVAEADELEKLLGRERVYEITGLPIHAMFSLNKIPWLKKHLPDLFIKTDRFLTVEDYLLTQMGLPSYINYSSACRTMGFDIRRKTWSQEILDAVGLSKDRLAEPVPSGIKAGALSESMARTLGVKAGIIVAMGGHDQPCGALGAGVIQQGQVADSAGTYECLTAVSNQPCNTPESLKYSLNSYCHVVEDQFVTLAFFPAGLVSRWFIDTFCENEKLQAEHKSQSVYEMLERKIAEICSGPTGVCITPHWVGACNPHWDVHATGTIYGLTPSVTRYHLYKAIYEGIACELDANIAVLEQLVGEIQTIRIFGGNSESEFTVQLRADVTGKIFQPMNHSEACCQGAAILAGIAAGIHKNVRDGVESLVQYRPIMQPKHELVQKYEKQKKIYAKLYPSLKNIQTQEKFHG